MKTQLQTALDQMTEWMVGNNVLVNAAKAKLLLLPEPRHDYTFHMDGHILESCLKQSYWVF